MPHQCIHCSKIINIGSKELLEGCGNCHGKFFFYIRDEQLEKIKKQKQELGEKENTLEFSAPEHKELEHKEPEAIIEFTKIDKKKVEDDVRSILGMEDETEPVILDLESIRVLKPGKFEIDLVSLINRKPIVFKLEEGKYIIDIESGMRGK